MNKIVYILVILFCSLSFAQNSTLFEVGNTLYNDGKYAEAIEQYESILNNDMHSAELYFNLGNAHYKLNNIAPSIYYFEKALQLSPNDSDLKNNIAFARNMTIDAIDVVPEVGFSKLINSATNSFSFDLWAGLAVSFVLIFVLLFLNYYFSIGTSSKRLSFVFSLLSLLLMCLSLSFAFHKFNLDKNNNPAIVFAQESKVKSEPNLRSEEVFRLHEGTKVQVMDSVKNWNKIKLSDGKMGWISNEDIKAL